MNALIVDDDMNQLNGIVSIVKKSFKGTVCLTASTYEEAVELLTGDTAIDIILLDIELDSSDNLTGVDLGSYIRTLPQFENTPILFITGYAAEAAHAIHATNCFDFLVKPFKPAELTTSIQKLIDKNIISEKPIPFRDLAGVHFRVLPSEIIYMSCTNHNTQVYTLSGTFTAHMSLADIMRKLPDYFIRCHKSYVVNKYFIANYDKSTLYITVRTAPQTSIPIGYAYHKSFVNQLRD